MTMPVIFLMGPTASGKTSLAVELVKELPVDIVSVDSAMVYRGMDIGTAKPSTQIQKIAPHRLIDILDPSKSYSAGNFVRDAKIEINDIHSRGRIPLLVGGTGLYFRSLEHGFSRLPPANKGIRSKLEKEADEEGWHSLYLRLMKIDPITADRIHPNDPQRIQRALEIHEVTGRPASELYAEGRTTDLSQPIIKIIIVPNNRGKLYADIEKRFLKMLEDGLVEEVKQLYDRGNLKSNLPAIRLVGYRQIWSYLNGDLSYKEMINKAIIATRQLAKRQITWLQSEQNALRIENNRSGLKQFLLNYLESNFSITDRL